MKTKISLAEIIKKVLDERGIEYEDSVNDSNITSLRRAFYKLIEKLGSNKEVLKQGGRGIEFEESEVPFMKVLLLQLWDNRGLIAEFNNARNGKTEFSEQDVRELIQSLIDEAEKSGMDEDEQTQMAIYFCKIFNYSPLRSVETCHKLIDALAASVKDLPIDQQAAYLLKVENMIKKEFALRFTEFTINTQLMAEMIEATKEFVGDIGIQNYNEYDPEIRKEYIQRDKQVLEAIQADDDLRQYIENRFGKKAEDIFNYAFLEE